MRMVGFDERGDGEMFEVAFVMGDHVLFDGRT